MQDYLIPFPWLSVTMVTGNHGNGLLTYVSMVTHTEYLNLHEALMQYMYHCSSALNP